MLQTWTKLFKKVLKLIWNWMKTSVIAKWWYKLRVNGLRKGEDNDLKIETSVKA